ASASRQSGSHPGLPTQQRRDDQAHVDPGSAGYSAGASAGLQIQAEVTICNGYLQEGRPYAKKIWKGRSPRCMSSLRLVGRVGRIERGIPDPRRESEETFSVKERLLPNSPL